MQHEEAFLKAYEKHSDAIFRYCYYRVYDREKALELMQEAFTKTWEQIAVKGKEIEFLRAFLYTTARNLIIDHSRKKKADSLEQLQDEGFQPVAHLNDPHLQIDAKHALRKIEKLDDQYQEVVYMRYVEGLKPKEISKIIGESQNVISVRIHRGLKQLKSLLQE